MCFVSYTILTRRSNLIKAIENKYDTHTDSMFLLNHHCD